MGREQVQMPGESYTYEWVAEVPGNICIIVISIPGIIWIMACMDCLSWKIPPGPMSIGNSTVWDEWDVNGDGTYDTHTINSRSAPDFAPLKAKPGERVRLILANIGFEFHTPHLHGQKWVEVNAGNPQLPGWDNPNGVLSIGPAEIRVVEFVARHAGTWMFHCHVLPHLMDDGKYPRGMMTVLNVTDDQKKASSPTDIEQGAEAEGAGLAPETEVASLPDIQSSEYQTGLADRGYDVYNTNCKACHGNLAKGEYGPALQQNPVLQDDDRFWQTVLKGKGNMPAWEERLSSQQIADVQAYLKTLKPPPPP